MHPFPIQGCWPDIPLRKLRKVTKLGEYGSTDVISEPVFPAHKPHDLQLSKKLLFMSNCLPSVSISEAPKIAFPWFVGEILNM
jgi:hypothetical protein